MSDDEQTSPNPVEKSILTEKEDAVLKAAWRCLKSAPDIDMEKLMQEANFNTMKTASNNWAVIKKKLNIATVPKTGTGGDPVTPKTKPKATATKKLSSDGGKRGNRVAAGDEDDENRCRTLKKQRTTPVKSAIKDDAAAADTVVDGHVQDEF